MSDAFYIDIQQLVTEVLTEFGTTFTVKTPGVNDPSTLTVSAGTEDQVLGLISDGSFVRDLVGEEPGINWASNRILLLLGTATIAREGSVVIDGVDHSLAKLEKIQPANINVLYILDLTK